MDDKDDILQMLDNNRSSMEHVVESEVCATDETLVNPEVDEDMLNSVSQNVIVNVNENDKNNVKKELIQYAACILIAILLASIIRMYVMELIDVDGSSMESTLSNGNFLILDKISYQFGDPERFDIIVFQPEFYDEDKLYIKRVIGLPGETVQIIDGDIYINGELLEEDYGKEEIEKSGRAEDEIVLGEDEYFVLGDNRNHSTDSRSDSVGNVKKEYIRGRAYARIWPLNKLTMLDHQ